MLISVNATVELVKYFGQIIYRTLQIYDIEPPEAVTEYYTLLHNVSALQSSDISVMDKRLNNAYELVSEMLNDSLSHLFSGSLWLLPTAVSTKPASLGIYQVSRRTKAEN